MQDSGTDFSSRLPAQSSSFDRYASRGSRTALRGVLAIWKEQTGADPAAWIIGRMRWPKPVRGLRLKSNAHCDRNNLSVKSSGGRVVVTGLEIKAITRLAYLDGETNSSVRAQGP
jgi:hypothetical protein